MMATAFCGQGEQRGKVGLAAEKAMLLRGMRLCGRVLQYTCIQTVHARDTNNTHASDKRRHTYRRSRKTR